jgi:hypothetical protein
MEIHCMSKRLVWILVCGALGLVIGYFLFGKVAGSYVSPGSLILPAEGGLARLGRVLTGVDEIRRKVLITGGIGAAIGAALVLVRR